LRELSEATSSSTNRSSKKFKSDETSAWQTLKKERGAVPVGIFGDDALGNAQTLLDKAEELVKQWGFPTMVETEREISLQLPNGLVEGSVSYFETEKLAGFASLYGVDRLRSRAAILLLILAAQGKIKHSAILFGYDHKAKVIKGNNVFFENALTQEDALRRLAGLIDAVHTARTIPAVKFGGTVEAIFAAEASDEEEKSPEFAFDKFVASDEYGKSLERRLFGEEPKYSDVFATDGPIREFWLSLKGAMNGPNHKPGMRFHEVTNIKVSDYIVQ
jgi:hypothetical protein